MAWLIRGPCVRGRTAYNRAPATHYGRTPGMFNRIRYKMHSLGLPKLFWCRDADGHAIEIEQK
jgi:hypothetical protein